MASAPIKSPLITLRIPGLWESRSDFEQSLPENYALHADGARLITPEGDVEFGVVEADDQLAQLMLSGCKHEPSKRL